MNENLKNYKKSRTIKHDNEANYKSINEKPKNTLNCYFYRSPPDTTDRSPFRSKTMDLKERSINKSNRLKGESLNIKSKLARQGSQMLVCHLNSQILKLKEENTYLKQQILSLRVSQFYQINQHKVQALVYEIQDLKDVIKKINQQNLSLQLQNTILRTSNQQLKKLTPDLGKAEKRQKSPSKKKGNLMKQRCVNKNQAYCKNTMNELCKAKSQLCLNGHKNLSNRDDDHQSGSQNINTYRNPSSLLTITRYSRSRRALDNKPQIQSGC